MKAETKNVKWVLVGNSMRRGKGNLLFWIAVIALSSVFLSSALHAESIQFDEVHQRYLSLRNTDLEFKRAPEWVAVAEGFIGASWHEKEVLKAQRSLYEAAILFRTLSKNQKTRWYQLRSLALLEELVGRFSTGELADDALLLQADILKGLGQKDSEQALLQEIIDHYSTSDMVFVARKRLQNISSATDTPRSSSTIVDKTLPIIVLDPGHGGEDFGALGVGGLLEKDVALSISLRVKKLLEKDGHYRVVLTRSADRFSPLAERMSLANRINAKLFLSIHANASVGKKLSGVETYYLDNAADKASATLAERENKSGPIEGGTGADLSFMLSDLIQNAKLPESIELAKSVQRGVLRSVKPKSPELTDLGVKAGPFYVLVGAHMPCALVEVSFIDHPIEGENLGRTQYRELIAQGVADGVINLDAHSKRR